MRDLNVYDYMINIHFTTILIINLLCYKNKNYFTRNVDIMRKATSPPNLQLDKC